MAVTADGRTVRPRWWTAGLAWALWALVVLSLVLNWWQDRLLRQAGRPDLARSEPAWSLPSWRW